MSDNWQPGDLALCVNQQGWWNSGMDSDVDGPQPGSLNQVTSVGGDGFGETMLFLAGWGDHQDWWAGAFRKIPPPSDEERDEFLRELKTPERVA